MSKRKIFLLCILSFIVGFILRELLLGVSQNKYLETEEINTYENDFEDANANEGPLLELVKIETPLKAFRGHYLEGIVYLKVLRRGYGNYALCVSLNNMITKDAIISSAKYPITISKNWMEDKLIKIGPFSVPIPESAKLGEYAVEVKLTDSSESRETEIPIIVKNNTNDFNTKIEVVSYSN